ncbi:MAG TPA: malonyl-ACP O-methyltransferase BioC [Dongiaceae bacterium]|nr:malonyl-ACP O-methyltransferase BioC [Dongiaceae bacterium]
MSGIVSRTISGSLRDDEGSILPSQSTVQASSTISVNKRVVAHSFSRAAPHYDQVAQLQMQVGHQLLTALKTAHPSYNGAALDIGCGTGKLTRELRPFCQRLIALDFAPGMLQFARDHHADVITDFVCADADALPFVPASLDRVFSNFALQWSASLPRLIHSLGEVLRPGGQLAFSIPAEGTLWELQNSWQQADPSHRHVNTFLSETDVRKALLSAGFHIDTLQVDTVVMQYASVRELTQELKTLGAQTVNGENNRPLTGKAAVARMLEAYEGLRQPNGRLPATWKILKVVARRPLSLN